MLRELIKLSIELEDYDPRGAFALRQEAGYFTRINFRLPVFLKSGRVSVIEALRVSHGPPSGKFLLASGASPTFSEETMRFACLERTLKACLHDLDWRGAETVVRCDPRELSSDVRAAIGSALAVEREKRRTEKRLEFLLPWRRLPCLETAGESRGEKALSSDSAASAACSRLGFTSLLDLYQTAVLDIFPTACASRGIKMDACTVLVRGRGSWAFRLAESTYAAHGCPVKVEVAGVRYRPAQSRSSLSVQRGQQGRWEPDDRDTSPDVLVLLGGSEPIDSQAASSLRSCLVFHVHRESLTPDGERTLRNKGIVVVPHLLLCSFETLVAESLAAPGVAPALLRLSQQELDAKLRSLRSEWRQRMLGAWERILAKTKEEQCTAHEAAIRIAARHFLEDIRRRLAASTDGAPGPGDRAL